MNKTRSSYTYRRRSNIVTRCILLALFLPLLGAGYLVPVPAIRIIFLHHSCGENLINQGNVREELTALGYEFYDHGYNDTGLRLADGSYAGTNFDVPGDNTDPDGLAAIFAQPLHDPPDNAFSHLMEYDVIVFKSCYPTSNISSDEHLAEYKSYYLSIRNRMDQYPQTMFIIVTQPPQVPGDSSPDEAVRARALVNWLQSDEYLAGHPNVFTFDFFGLLAGDDDFLRAEYRFDDYDGHPNEQANRNIGPLFVEFIDEAIQSYATGMPRPTIAVPTIPPTEMTTQPPSEEAAPSPPPHGLPATTAGVIDDFESIATHWESNAEAGSAIEFDVDTGTAHSGTASLRISYDVLLYGWADCGRHFESLQDWRGGTGLSLWLRSDDVGKKITLMLFSGDPDGPTPFEASFETTDDWAQYVLPWPHFTRAEWADEGGLSKVDPARVIGYGFNISADAADNAGILWVDDVSLSTSEERQPSPVPIPTDTPAAPASVEAPVVEPGEEVAEAPVEEKEEEPGSARGVCSGAAIVLPLGALGIFLARRRS